MMSKLQHDPNMGQGGQLMGGRERRWLLVPATIIIMRVMQAPSRVSFNCELLIQVVTCRVFVFSSSLKFYLFFFNLDALFLAVWGLVTSVASMHLTEVHLAAHSLPGGRRRGPSMARLSLGSL